MSRWMTKPRKWHAHPAKTQIGLGIRPVWSVFVVPMKKHWGLSYPMSPAKRLIRLDGCACWSESSLGAHFILLVLLCRGSYQTFLWCWRCHIFWRFRQGMKQKNQIKIFLFLYLYFVIVFICFIIIRFCLRLILFVIIGPRHDKTSKMSVRPAKTQINLSIRPVWSESSRCAEWVVKDPSFLLADSEESDQTRRMARLIWVFAGRTVTLFVLSCRGSYRASGPLDLSQK